MCSPSCIDFGKKYIKEEYVKDRAVIEVGAYNFNGSLRSLVEDFYPASYIGVDISPGPAVDQICNAEDLIASFGNNKFDMLICTELLEHVGNWQKVVHNIKNVMKPRGILILSTRSIGFPWHPCPNDFWRFQIQDIRLIFSDFAIDVLKSDPHDMGVFLFARKPNGFVENNLNNYKLYSMICVKQTKYLIYCILWRNIKKVKYYLSHPSKIFNFIKRKVRAC